ncbi:hypothetical protein BGX26_010344 [Mortierella sp. AD094]|nr:hypothetical protein BGX26_010344 [Mortierella sp. AD094]
MTPGTAHDRAGSDNGILGITTPPMMKSIPDPSQKFKEESSEASLATAQSASTTPPTAIVTTTAEITTGKEMENHTTTTDAVINKKTRPKRAMVLTGMPAPALPPRPIFPTELESYQAQGHANGLRPQYNALVQAYISSLRQDYERQLKVYEDLKNSVKEDTFFAKAVVDELDALDEDPFTLDSFENLMRLHASKNKDFILARVTTQDPNDETKLYHSYYGAHQINKVLFRTQPDEGLLHRMKACNPLNNMLVVGDVHYYIISAEELNAIKPLPAPRSSNVSVSSHSSHVESLESIIPPLMSMSILKADQEDGSISDNSNNEEPQSDTSSQDNMSSRARRGSVGSCTSATSNLTPFISQSGFQPCRPSRLRQAIDPMDQESGSNRHQSSHDAPTNTDTQSVASLTFSSTTSTAGDDDQEGDLHKCRSNTSFDTDSDNASVSSPIPSSPSSLSSSGSSHAESVTYNFKYLASDDDFLLRSSIRQVFKVNALESWDAILFTISNNALREYSNHGGEQGLQQPQQQQQQQQQGQDENEEDEEEDSEPDTPLNRSPGRVRSRGQNMTSMQPPSSPGNSASIIRDVS